MVRLQNLQQMKYLWLLEMEKAAPEIYNVATKLDQAYKGVSGML